MDLPAILAALGGVIVAVTGLIVALTRMRRTARVEEAQQRSDRDLLVAIDAKVTRVETNLDRHAAQADILAKGITREVHALAIDEAERAERVSGPGLRLPDMTPTPASKRRTSTKG